MNAETLRVGTQLKGRTSGKLRIIAECRPATATEPRQWLVDGNWFNYAQLEARYTVYNPTGRKPGKKQKLAA